jgi:beta-mannosidase
MNKKCLLFFMVMLSRSIAQRLLLLFMISMFCQVSAGSLQMLRVQRILSEGWMIRQVDADTVEIEGLTGELIEGNRHWMAVDKMPRQVAEVLLEHGKIPDPRISRNAAKCAWVWEKDWVYATQFDSPQGTGPTYLRFLGVDTKASVYLNGTFIGKCNNMYRRYTFDIRPHMHKQGEKNSLLVLFTGPARSLKSIEAEHEPAQDLPAYKYWRKCSQDFSEYLGPKPNFMKVGMFRDVILDVPGNNWIEDVYVQPELNRDLTRGYVKVLMEAAGESGSMRWVFMDRDEQTVAEGIVPDGEDSFEFEVPGPNLWWPHTHGDPYLYTMRIEMQSRGVIQDIRELKVGFRKVEQVLMDEANGEARFAFKINGKMIFLMGAGWAPLDGMTHRWDKERSDRQIDMAVHANMNVFRMWAGGNIPPASWYDECDRRGILVWQDFYFGYGVHPYQDIKFRKNVEMELEDMIKRLRNHPSIFIWTGGNENIMGWEFGRGYVPAPGRDLFESLMPELVNQLDPGRPYHPSSPWGGPHSNYPLEGDWHDYTTLKIVPLSSVPLYASEVCRVSAYSIRSMKRFLSEEELWPDGFQFTVDKPGKIAWPEMWQYRSAGSAWQKLGQIEDFCDPQSAADLVRITGIAHGEYLQKRVERQRRGVPDGEPDGNRRCWGNQVWRLNDAWPIIYMSLIDYYLEPKIPYYYTRRAYSPVLVTFEQTADRICTWIVNDSPESVEGTLILKKMNFLGEVLGQLSEEVRINPGESRRILDAAPLRTIVFNKEFLVAEFNGQVQTLLLNGERHLQLPNANLSVTSTSDGISISTDKYARQVILENPEGAGDIFEDNYFDMIPGQTKTVEITPVKRSQKILIRSLNALPIEIVL